MKKIFKLLIYPLVFLLLITALYISIAYIFTFFPKKVISQEEKKESVYILYNPIHTDIVLDIQEINLTNFPKFQKYKKGYLAFGWGDKETYLTTPTSNDFKVTTSLKALFLNTPSLMHVTYIADISRYKEVQIFPLSIQEKIHLKKHIMQTFTLSHKRYVGYGKEDFFYDAQGNYNLVKTCNTWTGDRLRDANVTMPYWTPFRWSVVSKN